MNAQEKSRILDSGSWTSSVQNRISKIENRAGFLANDWAVAGLVFGVVAGFWHLIMMTRPPSRPAQPGQDDPSS